MNLNDIKLYITKIYENINKEKLIIGGLIIFLLVLLFSLIGECENNKTIKNKYEQNLLALNDSIRKIKRNADNLSFEKAILIIDNKNLKYLNDSLLNEIKKLKLNIKYINIINTEVIVDKLVPSIIVGDSVIKLDSNNRISKVNWINEYSSGSLYMNISGYGLYYYNDSSILVKNFITDRYLKLDLKTYIFEDKGKYYTGVSTLKYTPEVNFNLIPVIIDDGYFFSKKKDYKISIGIGPHIGIGYNVNKQILPYIGFGINLNYNLLNIY